jgi:hypothetical protein
LNVETWTLRRNLMNALQTIPPKPVARVRRSAFRLRASDAILLLALIGGMTMSRGEEGTTPEPGAAVLSKGSGDEVGDKGTSPSVVQPAAVSAGATTQVSPARGDDEKTPASAPSAEPSAAPAPTSAGVSNDREPAAAEANSDTAALAEIKNRNARGRDGGRVPAKRSATSSASAASKDDLVSKREDGRVRKTAPGATAVRSAESARRASQFRSEVDYRTWKAADRGPVSTDPLPIIYGPGAGARAPYAPPYAMQRQDWMTSAVAGPWERVVDAPVVVLNGGKNALYGILDSLW